MIPVLPLDLERGVEGDEVAARQARDVNSAWCVSKLLYDRQSRASRLRQRMNHGIIVILESDAHLLDAGDPRRCFSSSES